MKFPIIYWQQNIIFDFKRRAFAVYKLPLINYSLLSVNDKVAEMYKLRELLYNVQGSYHILSLCKGFEVESYKSMLTDLRESNYLPTEFDEHVRATHNGLSNRRPWNRHLYLIKELPIKKINIQVRDLENMRSNFKDILRTITDIFVPTQPYIPQIALESAMNQEENLAQEVRNSIGAARASSKEIEWIIKHSLFRSLGDPEISTNWNPAAVVEISGMGTRLIPLTNEILSHVDDCYMYEGIDHVKIIHTEGLYKGQESYQALLAISNYPEQIKFPGSEFYHWLEDLDFPVDVSIRVHSYVNREAEMKLSGKLKELQDQKSQHMHSVTGVPFHIQDDEYKGLELESKLRSGMPLLDVSTVMCVSGTTREEVEKRATSIIDLYRPKQYKVVRTPGDQKKFFASFIPGQDVNLKDHTVPMDPEFFASGMVNASRQIGDPFGFYFGDNLSGSMTPVFMYPLRGPRYLNRSAATAILGTLGGGKSVTRKYILYAAMTIWGAKVISIDPKDEDGCFTLIPEIAQRMKKIDLGPGSDVCINPFHIATREEETRSIVTDLLFMLLNAESDEKEVRQVAIHKAISYVMELPHKKRNLNAVTEAFDKVSVANDVPDMVKQEAVICKTLMQAFRELSFSRLLFSDYSNIDASAQLTVFNFAGLPLPADRNAKMTNSEKFGSAILFLVTQFARQILINSKEYRHTLKILSIDEAWKMMMTPEGIRLITEIIRMGRSMGIMPIIATQNASDLSSTDIRNNLGMVLMFRNPDRAEITECLDLIGLDKEDEALKQRIPQFQSGQCIFRDIEGRIGEMIVRPRPNKLLKVFDTRV